MDLLRGHKQKYDEALIQIENSEAAYLGVARSAMSDALGSGNKRLIHLLLSNTKFKGLKEVLVAMQEDFNRNGK